MKPSYAQLLETNNLITNFGDSTYWLCLTRTVQGSKLFPVSAYILLSYLNAFYRYPTLLRAIEERMPAERIGDRARGMAGKLQNSHMGWALPCFYLLGREWLIAMGMIRPEDAAEDVVYVLDFWKRFMLAWRRNDGHITNAEFGQRVQILPDRQLEVFKADLFACAPGDPLHGAAQAFLATASQYGFLVSAESRISLTNTGPYRLDADHELMVRDFMDLSECSLPWADDVAAGVPHNHLTVPMAARGCHFHLVDDWGSFESTPEFGAERLAGIGLYTSDALSEGYEPVGMGSADELAATFRSLDGALKAATTALWTRMAGWTRDQLIDAGALAYYSVAKDLAHVAGVFDPALWLTIDPRAERFRPILNDEFANQALGELVGSITLPSQRQSPFVMAKWSDAPRRVLTPIPYAILEDGADYAPSAGPAQPGTSHLPPKNDRYRTTRGVLGLAEYNARAAAFTPAGQGERHRHVDETWVKYHPDDPRVAELYGLARARSRTLGPGRG